MVAVLGYSRQQITQAVQGMYHAVAEHPDDDFHFPVGRSASRRLGYPEEQIAALPEALIDSFAGVGYPFRAKAIHAGDRVLDIGAGAGNDALIACRLTGEGGHVIALDLTAAMTRKLRENASLTGVDNLSVVQASAEHLPLPAASVDSITSNGALNLVPDKRRAIAEMFRVLRPGGRLQLADVVIHRPVSVDCHEDPRLWVECVVGATVKEHLMALFEEAGFEEVEVVGSHDYFALSPSDQTREVAESFGAHAIEVGMYRGDRVPTAFHQWRHRLNPRRWLLLLRRRGLLGLASLGLALLSCYGTLALVGLLPMLGIGLAVNEEAWAVTIAGFTLLTVIILAAGIRQHRHLGPTLLVMPGCAAILHALFIDYQAGVELGGFVILAAAALWDLKTRRQQEARVLGLA
jgi:SAM-dependent methyltransferase